MRKTDASGKGFDAGITADMKSAIKKELENLEKQEGFTIPMEFHDLIQLIETPKLLDYIDSLLKKKIQAREKDKISPIPDVQEYIEIQYERCKKIVQQFTSFKKGPDPLDSFFRNMLQRVAAK